MVVRGAVLKTGTGWPLTPWSASELPWYLLRLPRALASRWALMDFDVPVPGDKGAQVSGRSRDGAQLYLGTEDVQMAAPKMPRRAGHQHWSIVVWPKPIKGGRKDVIML